MGLVSDPASFPEPGTKIAGFRGSLRIGNVICTGSMPVQIRLNAVGTFPADRNFVFRFRGASGEVAPARRDLQVEVKVTAKQGTRSLKQILYLPKWAAVKTVEFQVMEDRQELQGYSARVILPSVAWATTRDETFSTQFANEHSLDCLLIVNSDTTSVRKLTPKDFEVFLRSDLSARKDPDSIAQSESDWFDVLAALAKMQVRFSTKLSLARFDETPSDWRGYQAFDWVCVNQSTLEVWMQQHPHAQQALRDWVMMGGTLVVQAAEADDPSSSRWAIAGDVVQELDAIAAAEEPAASWDAPLRNARDFWGPNYLAILTHHGLDKHSSNPPSKITLSEWNRQIHRTILGCGMVFLITPKDDDGHQESLNLHSLELIDHATRLRHSPMLRRGVDPMIGDRRFRKFLIPGVAQPPVYTFMGLLTLFVVLVGPIAYRQTTIAGRGHLMFVIAPLLAIITTLLMFGYGLIADGLGTIARLRQITIVDSGTGDAIERCRSSYFAGVRPRDSLVFPTLSEVMLYPESNKQSLRKQIETDSSIRANVTVTPEHQSFSNSLIASRTTTQFVTHRPIRKLGHLLVDEGMPENGPPLSASQRKLSVSNHFEFPLRRMILRDGEKAYWLVPEIKAGETQVAQFLPPKKSSSALGKLYTEFRISMPTTTTGQRRRQRNRAEVFDLISTVSQTIRPGSILQDGVAEAWLQNRLQLNADLPTRYFMAISDPNEEDLLVEGAELVDSIRYVMGTFRQSASMEMEVDPTGTKP